MNGLNSLISALRNLFRRFAAGATVLKRHQLWFVSIDLRVRKTLVFAMDTFTPNGCVFYLISQICKSIGLFPAEAGVRKPYHALTLGFCEVELLRWVDPQYRSLGQLFEGETATPIELVMYIGLPESIPNSLLAKLASPG